jgi:hypothetical protein
LARLFISYARKDGGEFCRQLKADLAGHDAWLDVSGIVGGETWTRDIENAIDTCQAMLAVLTGAYHRSRVAGMELARAHRKNKRLFPLRLHADAESPLLLETTQWLDFTSPDAYRTVLGSLLERLAELPAPPPEGEAAVDLAEDPGAAAEAAGWEAVRARCAEKVRRFVRENQGTTKAPGGFVPELYVRRATEEQALAPFLAGPAAALLLVGDAGVGKTNLLCRWALDLVEQGHAVLPYAGDALADCEVEREIARDLGVGEPRLPQALAELDAQAAREGRRLVIVFDSVNEYQGSERDGTQALVRRINAFAGRLPPGTAVRVLVSCSSASWSRLERLAPLRLDPGLYFRVAEGEPIVRMAVFTPPEMEAAYALYRARFELPWPLDALPPALRERLRQPLLLRLTAEAYSGQDHAPVPGSTSLGIYQRFFVERVRLEREVAFVDELADEMLGRRASALPVSELIRHEALGREILDEDQFSTYQRLLDRGVLQESRADARSGTVVKFAYNGLAAYALAQRARKVSPDDARTAATLVGQAGAFPLAWEVAETVLLLGRTQGAFDTLATSINAEHRELATEALAALHVDDPKAATTLIDALLWSDAEEARRTGLKAAYKIGPPARDLFLRTALEGGRALQQSLKDTLYLIWRRESRVARREATDALYLLWRQAPGFTYELLHDLLAQIGLRNVRRIRPILEFVLDLSITIYINHCDQDEVVQKTAHLYHELATERLHLDLLNTGLLGPRFERLVFRSVAHVFARRVLGWMLLDEGAAVHGFFDLPTERRACLSRIADVLEPGVDLGRVRGDLVSMLGAEVPLFAGAAAFAIAVHACRDARTTEPLVRQLYDELPASGRRWLLAGFSVLQPGTPPEWLGMLEALTERYLGDHRADFLDPAAGRPAGLDLVLMPLGLAYGKQGPSMPLYERLLVAAAAAGDGPLVARGLAALGPVGFYHPEPVFEVLQKVGVRDDGPAEEGLVSSLATIRTIHFDAVDRFLDRVEASERLRRRIDTAADIGLVHRYIHVLGHYNNAVHYTLHYPKMRRPLAMGALKLMAEAPEASHFIGDYTATAVRMFREAGFQLLEWTRPD